MWIHQPVRHNEIVAFRLILPGGSSDEPQKLTGITRLMGAAMLKGTARRSSLEIAQQIESLGAALDISSDEDYWDINGQVISDKFEKLLPIVQDVLLNPSFPPNEFEKEKQAQLNSIRANKEHIFTVAMQRLQREVFGDHPYGRPEEGTEATVASLTREEVARWHKERIQPKGSVLVTVGNISVAKMEQMIQKTFKDWTGAGTPPQGPGDIQYPRAPKSVQEIHPFEQGYLMLAFAAPGVAQSDYPAIKVLNTLLGAGMSSPLFQVVREEGGLAYEVSSFYPSRKLGSAFVIYAGTDPGNVDLAHEKIKTLLDDFRSKPVPEKALDDAKRFVRGHYMMDHQTNSRMAWYLGWWEILGKGHQYDGQYSQDIQSVSAEDVRRVAQQILKGPATVVKIRPK
ncbi:MAG: insulinase family protein [Elusimicrobia bacterium]|nr:insulinase family protein [Elusimicrobiota bacterium]